MPGVLMLEALFQASCWLVRATEEFENSVLVLKEARNVRFADFMEPNQTLEITAEIIRMESNTVVIKATGTKGETVAVSARLIIEKSNMQTKDADLEPLDQFLRESMRVQFEKLTVDLVR